MIRTPDEIAPVLKRAFEIEGPALIGVHADHRDNHVRWCVQKQHRLTAPDTSISCISSSEGYV
jgi:thiamine pyrophosphate-dependent acetolactate synthase large subunit-like protein